MLKLAAFASALLIATPAFGAVCGERDKIIAQLNGKYYEGAVAAGLVDDKHLLEVYTKKDGGTWTIGITDANGVMCLLVAGSSWQYNPDFAKDLKSGPEM